MITKVQFKSALEEIKKEFPDITVLATTLEEKPFGTIWFAYTFLKDKTKIKEMKKELKHDFISENVNDMLDTNSDKLNYVDLVSDWKYWIEDFLKQKEDDNA